MQFQKWQNDLCSVSRWTIQITVTQGNAPNISAGEVEVELQSWSFDDLQELLELTSKKDVLFNIGDWNAKVGSQEIPGIRDKFDLEVQDETGQRLPEFCQKNALVMANTLFQQHKGWQYI